MERREKRFASRILAWFLTFLMITTMIPTSAFAALPAQDTGAVVSEDASSDETTQDGILLKTTLTDKLKVKGQRKLLMSGQEMLRTTRSNRQQLLTDRYFRQPGVIM